ncbi:hypothetical protein [Streptomyces sp. NPDC001665]
MLTPAVRLRGTPARYASGTVDARLATLVKHCREAATAVRKLLYVHAGRRISAGMLTDGELHSGHEVPPVSSATSPRPAGPPPRAASSKRG